MNDTKATSYLIFDRISHSYDRINRLLSFGIDIYWRFKLLKYVPKKKTPLKLVDLATGTGDQLFSLLKYRKNIMHAIGLDLSTNMLSVAKKKAKKRDLSHRTVFEDGDAQNIPLNPNCADLVTMSFGIRNVPDTVKCIQEMHRILETGGKSLILEFSLPTNKLIKSLYLFYLRKILPPIGNLLSKDSSAYTYLNQTIETFPYGEDFLELMRQAGFKKVEAKPLTFGIATLYIGEK
ncbi:MAG: bifunctional demethylmenaquinone methyltransferase/2-methoxy-6-polyprenyl-1,4-benzoquinol methylase UbiE [Rhabdochlamydiaceae bacterium]|nr:bifunctional demethylmenaquinone methyltransferase/2-methoxy-6-polyprenyl-1,4-benzoquinol methylase UbiE [Candidatus Amphrikana amoebophyrae]